MQTNLDCIPCFYKQVLRAAKLSGADLKTQREVLIQLSELIPELSLDTSPAEMGRAIYAMISKVTGKKDPYKEIKEESNKIALRIYPEMKTKVMESENQLLTALQLSIIGNLIGFGLKDFQKISLKIDKIIDNNFYLQDSNFREYFNYQSFCQRLSEVQSVFYLADSAGEVVFDLLFIEQLVTNYDKNVIYVVKGKPVLIDALVDDAIYCGINNFAKIISSGADCPGVVLKYCSPEFIRLFNEAEMIISKGQGNYGALSEEKNPLFFLLIAKCPIIAKHIGCNIGDFVLENNFKEHHWSMEDSESKKQDRKDESQ
ncbi:MAG TPA: ARMT1-like domain-containing protein [Atribacterota bacterium]|nr:ARMT1-like domain-containing protein [Atribacterota bacterium]